MNADKAFFDTNVLLYMYGSDAPKQRRALSLFEEYSRAGRLVLSTQVVQEFYSVAVRKLPLSRREIRQIAERFLMLPITVIGPAEITTAMTVEERYGISFWDALIVAAAESGGADILYTEDLNNGQRYGSVIACNPFAA
jgi:predicted nucleic acid-binding protein